MKLLENKAYRRLYDKMKELYEFGFCPLDDIEKLVDFLSNNWKKNHSLCVSRELMDWQFKDEKNEAYTFVIAKHKESLEIHAILGAIPANGNFELDKPSHFYLSIIKTLNDKSPSLTMLLYCYMEDHFDVQSCTSNSFGSLGEQVFRKIGFEGSVMKHYYIVNKNFSEFKIIDKFDTVYCSNAEQDKSKKLQVIDKNEFIKYITNPNLCKYLIEKTKDFYIKRYVNHPIYKYEYLAIKKDSDILGIFVYRVIFEGNNCIKIIDFVGEEDGILGLVNRWQCFLEKYNAEYIDIYNIGFEEDLMTKSGFIRRDGSSNIIVPHYFEPFVRQNIELVYGVNTDLNKKLMLFRGDGDQDRPQIIKQEY